MIAYLDIRLLVGFLPAYSGPALGLGLFGQVVLVLLRLAFFLGKG